MRTASLLLLRSDGLLDLELPKPCAGEDEACDMPLVCESNPTHAVPLAGLSLASRESLLLPRLFDDLALKRRLGVGINGLNGLDGLSGLSGSDLPSDVDPSSACASSLIDTRPLLGLSLLVAALSLVVLLLSDEWMLCLSASSLLPALDPPTLEVLELPNFPCVDISESILSLEAFVPDLRNAASAFPCDEVSEMRLPSPDPFVLFRFRICWRGLRGPSETPEIELKLRAKLLLPLLLELELLRNLR